MKNSTSLNKIQRNRNILFQIQVEIEFFCEKFNFFE